MKKLRKETAISRVDHPHTKLSVEYEGQWVFATLATPTRVTETQSFYLISYPFGLVKQAERNPRKTTLNGKIGSYVAKNNDGTLTVVTKEEYDRLFPRSLKDRPYTPVTSDALTDPNYLTTIVRKSRAKDSNTIQVGTNNTFTSVNANTSIIITPAGVQEGLVVSGTTDPYQVGDPPEPETGTEPVPFPIGNTIRTPFTGY